MTEADNTWYLPQDVYDKLMSLPPGTDVTEYFEFDPAWKLKITVAEDTTTGEQA